MGSNQGACVIPSAMAAEGMAWRVGEDSDLLKQN